MGVAVRDHLSFKPHIEQPDQPMCPDLLCSQSTEIARIECNVMDTSLEAMPLTEECRLNEFVYQAWQCPMGCYPGHSDQ